MSDFKHPLAQIALEQSRVIRMDKQRKRRELAREVSRDLEAWDPNGPEGEALRQRFLEQGMEP